MGEAIGGWVEIVGGQSGELSHNDIGNFELISESTLGGFSLPRSNLRFFAEDCHDLVS